jgi:hypothetical protein
MDAMTHEIGTYSERSSAGRDTRELQSNSPLELMLETQEILTHMVAPNKYAVNSPEAMHEQSRQALNLVLRAISILQRQSRRDLGNR